MPLHINKTKEKNNPDATVKRIRFAKRAVVTLGICLLILISLLFLLRGCRNGEWIHGSVDIPGNVIDPIPSITPRGELTFRNETDEENLPFDVKDMDGGDRVSRLYRVVATYNSDFVLNFDMTIRENEEFQKLAEILKLKVELVYTDSDVLLYDGLLADISTLEIEMKTDTETTVEYFFRITAYLDAPLDDAYYGQSLVADMSWQIEGQDTIAIANCEFATISKSAHPTVTPELNFLSWKEDANTAFDMRDIQNGDSQTKYFAFELVHGEDVKIVIENTSVLDTALGDVLTVRIDLVGKNGKVTLYEGPLKELSAEHTVPKNADGKTALYYEVTVTAEGLTERYCGTKLVCDLSWTPDGTSESCKVPSNHFVAYEKPYTPSTPSQPTETAAWLELTAKNGYQNIPFDAHNMLPGDAIAQYYCVSVTHVGTKTVRFGITVDQTQMLANVLRVKVEQLIPDAEDKTLYDGWMKDCVAVDVSVTARTQAITPIYYRVTVYTNGAEVGSEYAGASLNADFSWQLQ